MAIICFLKLETTFEIKVLTLITQFEKLGQQLDKFWTNNIWKKVFVQAAWFIYVLIIFF